MSGKVVFLVHPDADLRESLGKALHGAGLKVMTAAASVEVLGWLDGSRFFDPDVIVAPATPPEADGAALVEALRTRIERTVPWVVLLGEDPQERRRALRRGFSQLVSPPYDGEEVLLNLRLALERHRGERLVSGSLGQLSVAELLQTAEASRRSGRVELTHRGRQATVWLRDGRVIDAEIDDGRRGEEAVYAVAVWEEGVFEADFSPVTAPERIQASTSSLLLEAMRRLDEARRNEPPPHAFMPDPPPPPPRDLLAVHRCLTLLNIAASYASDHVDPAMLTERLEASRRALESEHPALACFQVEGGGQVSAAGTGVRSLEADAVVRAAAAWTSHFFTRMERALPGRFRAEKLRAVSEAIHEDLESLGFYRELGLAPVEAGTESTESEEHPS